MNYLQVVHDFLSAPPFCINLQLRATLDPWLGHLVCDDFAGYKQLFAQGVTEVGCVAHARRKFYDLHVASRSQIAEDALRYIRQVYDVEREARDLSSENRLEIRRRCTRPVAEALHAWMVLQRARVNEGLSMARAIAYSRRRWTALTRYLDDPQLPVDNN